MKETQLNGESLNIVTDNIEKMKQLFPEIITEDKIDFNKLKEILGKNIEESDERYNFTWPGKTEALRESQKSSTGTLNPCKEDSKNWDSTQNLYIEGDNLEVLKILQKSYYNKVKMIYIDPPYNTGKDFIYPDNYKDNLKNYLKITNQITSGGGARKKLTNNPETSGRFHSYWLNMLYPRLKLARNLLTDDGIIFISIDNHEHYNLKKICDEIFGEDNLISEFIWQKKSSGGQHSNYVLDFHEYILLYRKSLNKNFSLLVERTDEQKKSFKFSDKYESIRGKYLISPLKSWLDYRPTLIYDIYCPDGTIINTQWICSESTFLKLKKEDKILFKKNSKGKWAVYKKQYVNEKGGLVKPASMITEYGQTSNGKRDLKNLFNQKSLMDFPKPVKLIQYLISMIGGNGNIVMDFFSGSATMAHANFKNNIHKNISNRFIMVQVPEKTDEKSVAFKEGYKNICEIGKERIRRAGDKILEESNNEDLDIGFKVFKLDSSNLTKWNPDYDNLEDSLLSSANNIISGRSELDLVYEVMLKYGIDLSVPVDEIEVAGKKVFNVGFGALFVCLDDDLTVGIADGLVGLIKDSDSSVTRVVFKDNGFASDSDKANVKETLSANNVDEFITI